MNKKELSRLLALTKTPGTADYWKQKMVDLELDHRIEIDMMKTDYKNQIKHLPQIAKEFEVAFEELRVAMSLMKKNPRLRTALIKKLCAKYPKKFSYRVRNP